MAGKLRLRVVAEGVETRAQLAFLATCGCDEIQGYYFSPPVSAEDCTRMLVDHRKLALPPSASSDTGRTLLLVDDEARILSALKRVLRHDGYRILTAGSAAEGLEVLACNKIAVVVTDQRMPEMAGVEFLRRVKDLYPDTVRIMLSGYTDFHSITDAINRGAIYKFLTKPWDDQQLRDNIGEAFRRYELVTENERLRHDLSTGGAAPPGPLAQAACTGHAAFGRRMTTPKAPLVDVRSDRTELSWIFDLYRMTPAISKVSPQDVSQRLLEHIVTGFAAGSGCLAVSDVETPDRLAIVAGIGLPSGVIGSHVTRGDGVLGWVAQHAEPLLLQNDVQNDPRFKFTVARTETKVPGSAMCWPLQNGDRVLGVVSVNRPFDQPAFSADDLEHGSLVMGLVTVMMENTRLQIEQAQRIDVLSTLNDVMNKINLQLEETQGQLLQSEKMASIGQLAAGVAHEINNPIGYVNSNLGSLEQFLQELFAVLAAYERMDEVLPEAARRDIQAIKARADLDYLRQDSFALLGECREGIDRVKKIVQDLRDFSPRGLERRVALRGPAQGARKHAQHRQQRDQVQGRSHQGIRDAARDRVPAHPAQPGVPEHPHERRTSHARRRDDHRALRHPGRGSVGVDQRHRARHSVQPAAAHLRPLLHHQAGRRRNRPRAVALVRHRGKASRAHRGAKRNRRRARRFASSCRGSGAQPLHRLRPSRRL